MRIWTLTENTACREDLKAEHGLSLYIETENHRILFDAGQTDVFADNARILGVDLSLVDLAVLSHGHYDHSGGFLRFLQENKKARVYVNQHAFEPHYNAVGAYIGMDEALLHNRRVVTVEDTLRLDEGITLHGCNDQKRSYPVESFGLTVLEDGIYRLDDFRHEQYLLIEEKGKRILISGCSHRGIREIVRWFQPDILIGGFHFMKLEPEGEGAATLQAAAEDLMHYSTIYYTGHCTGEAQYAFLKRMMGEQLHRISTGSCIEI